MQIRLDVRIKKPSRARTASNGAGEGFFGLWEERTRHIGGKNGLSCRLWHYLTATMPKTLSRITTVMPGRKSQMVSLAHDSHFLLSTKYLQLIHNSGDFSTQ